MRSLIEQRRAVLLAELRDIEFARLRASPGAKRDECQTRFEKTHIGTRSPTL